VPPAAGNAASPAFVHRLAALVDERTAIELERSLDTGRSGASLTTEQRAEILQALDLCPYGLSELHDVVVVESL
jgi:hypothetical protein